MIATKLLLVAMAASIKASPVAADIDTAPVASALGPTTTDWAPLPIQSDAINWDGIDMDAFNDPANWRNDTSLEAIVEGSTPNPAKDDMGVFGGPCDQGVCPDYNAAFDAVYTFTAVPLPGQPGSPPLTIFSSDTYVRINDCGECQNHKLGSNLNQMTGGCWDFRSCGRDQTICLDPGNRRAHRIWKGYTKTCYEMRLEYLGDCGFVKARDILRPIREVGCTW
jgi:hypothetical protein